MMSGPMPPSAPSRMIPSLSIQKWTGRASAPQRACADPSLSRPSGNVAVRLSAKAATAPSSSLTSIARMTSPSSRVAGREPVHQRELVDARRAVRAHEVDPDRLAAQVREVDRPAADLGHDERGRRLADVELTARDRGRSTPRPTRTGTRSRRPTDSPRPRSPDWGMAAIGAGRLGRRRRQRPRARGRRPGSPRAPAAATATPATRPATIDRRGHMCARRVPVRTGRSASAGLRATIPLPCRPFELFARACSRPC